MFWRVKKFCVIIVRRTNLPLQSLILCTFLFMGLPAKAQNSNCQFILQLIDEKEHEPLARASVSYHIKQQTTQLVPTFIAMTDINGQSVMQYSGEPLEVVVDYAGVKVNFLLERIECGRTLTYILPVPEKQTSEVVVTAFLKEKKLSVVPAALGFVDGKIISATDQTSLQNAINTVPGVIMESRGYGGSHRLNIRGSALRSPFAVRNVKMYLAGIPLTSPDGQTPLDMIDASDIRSVEIIKGPAGSIYGSGNGGVLLFAPKIAYANQFRAGTHFQAGSYDLYRSGSFAEVGFANSALRISHVWQDNHGYREQEFNRKNQVSLTYTNYVNPKHRLLFYGTYYAGNWALPGALNAAQLEDNPRQANNFSKSNNASVMRNRLMAGISHSWLPDAKFSGTTSAYFYSTHKLNPYGTSVFNSGYKDEGADGFGGRTNWGSSINTPHWNGGFNIGGEWQAEKYNILESTIVGGQPDEFKYLYDISYIAAMAFGQMNFSYRNFFYVDAGLSYNSNSQKVKGLTSSSFDFDTTATWKSQILPRLSISLRFPGDLFLYHSISSGNANPTAFEMVDYENNSYNLSLRPERGISREWGLRQNSPKSPLSFFVNYYDFQLTDMIVPFAISGPDDDMINLYRNAASADQRGFEWSVTMTPVTLVPGIELGWQSGGSVFRYNYDDFESDNKIYNEKMIPGIPRANAASNISVIVRKKVNFDILHYWYDRMPFDNGNLLWTSSYHLLNAVIATSFRAGEHFEFKLHGGINNILGTEYSSFLALNATNGRFFNPMPGANFFAGFGLIYTRN